MGARHPVDPPHVAAFQEALRDLGWNVGRNIQMDVRWASGNLVDNRKYAAELVAQAPDVILASTTVALGPLLELTHTIPIVFVNAADPVGGGYVESLARPGGNATGFPLFEYSMSGKWLELLKQLAPRPTRVGVLRDPTIAAGTGQFGAIQSVAPVLGVDCHPLNIRDAGEIARALRALARGANGGLIVTASTLATLHRELIVLLAARYHLPAIYFFRFFVARGGLISYGLTQSIATAVRLAMSTVFSKARSRPTCRCRSRSNTNSRSISRPPRRSVSKFRRRCSPAPTR